MKNNKAFLVILGIAFAIMAICGVRYVMANKDFESKLNEEATQIAELQNEIAVRKTAVEQAAANVQHQTTGLDASRKASDDKVAMDFMRKILTWSDYAGYTANRELCKTQYGLDEESGFMTTFLPEVLEVTSADGSKYNRIDLNGLNMRFGTMDTYVTDINAGGTQSYVAFVTSISRDGNGHEATGRMVFTYSCDPDGNLSEINGYTLAGGSQ